MTVKRKIAVCILTVLLLCNLGFIWGNSLASQSESHNLSVGVLTFLPRFIRGLFPNQEQLVYFGAEDGPLCRICLPGRAVLRASGRPGESETSPVLSSVGRRFLRGGH